MEVTRVAMETLNWKRKDVCDVITSQLHVTQPIDHTWATKRCKNYKFVPVYGVLMTLNEVGVTFTFTLHVVDNNFTVHVLDNNFTVHSVDNTLKNIFKSAQQTI